MNPSRPSKVLRKHLHPHNFQRRINEQTLWSNIRKTIWWADHLLTLVSFTRDNNFVKPKRILCKAFKPPMTKSPKNKILKCLQNEWLAVFLFILGISLKYHLGRAEHKMSIWNNSHPWFEPTMEFWRKMAQAKGSLIPEIFSYGSILQK